MERREFCRLVAAAATVIATPAIGGGTYKHLQIRTGDAAQVASIQGIRLAHSGSRLCRSFCATPANERQFYAFEGEARFIEAATR